jgi:hypothetical protein
MRSSLGSKNIIFFGLLLNAALDIKYLLDAAKNIHYLLDAAFGY